MSIISQSAAQTPITPFGDITGPDVQHALQQVAAGAVGGTVTSVSITTANGVSGAVANPTTTPAVTLTLGAITPSSVNTGALSATGAVISNNALSLPVPSPVPRLQLGGADAVSTDLLADAFGAQPRFIGRFTGGTSAAPVTLPTGQGFCTLSGQAYNGTAYTGNAAAIFMVSTEAWTPIANGCHIRLATTPNGSTTRVNSLVVSDSSVAALGAITGSNLSGTNTGDQLVFKTISVSGQSDIVADTTADTLTIAAGAGITLTTNAATDTLTIALGGTTTSANNGQAVTYGAAVGPGAAAVSIKAWLPITVSGTNYFIPLFGV